MDYRIIDWESYPRKAHFEYFNAMADPYAGVTVEVDITRFPAACRETGAPFFLSFLFCQLLPPQLYAAFFRLPARCPGRSHGPRQSG